MVCLFCFHDRSDGEHANGRYIVSQSDQVAETIKKVVDEFGKIDVFVANAGKVN